MKKMNDAQQMQLNTIMLIGLGKLGYTWDTKEQLVKDCEELATKATLEYALHLVLKVGLREAYYGRPHEFWDMLYSLGDKLNDNHILTGMKHYYKNGLFL